MLQKQQDEAKKAKEQQIAIIKAKQEAKKAEEEAKKKEEEKLRVDQEKALQAQRLIEQKK